MRLLMHACPSFCCCAGLLPLALLLLQGVKLAVRTLRAGAVFGEVALLTKAPRQADCVAATVSNMAVAEAHRRQGLGRLLLVACEQAALQYAPPATLMALAVFRHNDVARALYESSGYAEDESWVDPRWAASAERGRVDIARRLLLLKPLAAPP